LKNFSWVASPAISSSFTRRAEPRTAFSSAA
jgi:hypothetical protein